MWRMRERRSVVRAARWHDLGKVHSVFQDTMRRGLDGHAVEPDVLLAKTAKQSRHGRAFFRHELASALAFLAHERWSRDSDLTAYLIAAHHGKVRMNLRALPRESAPMDGDRAGARFARGVWEGDELPPFDLEGGDQWEGGSLLLSIMELGWDDVSRESWTERTRELLAHLGPFRLAWLETLVRIADWRASAKERPGDIDMIGEPIALNGCAPTPLASYLKALGVLRLISSPANHVSGEAADPHARGWWQNECFHLRTTLSRDALLHFFLHDYAPSPIIAPWNGGSGFYPKDNKDGFAPLTAGRVAPRFAHISSAIRSASSRIAGLGLTERPEGTAKTELVAALRASSRIQHSLGSTRPLHFPVRVSLTRNCSAPAGMTVGSTSPTTSRGVSSRGGNRLACSTRPRAIHRTTQRHCSKTPYSRRRHRD